MATRRICEGRCPLQGESGKRWVECGGVAELPRRAGGDGGNRGRRFPARIRADGESRGDSEGAVCVAVCREGVKRNCHERRERGDQLRRPRKSVFTESTI